MKRQVFYILILMILFGCDSTGSKKSDNSNKNYAESGKLQELIDRSSVGDIIDLSDVSADDTRVVINKGLTLKNGTLDGISLEITDGNVTLQNVTSVKNVVNSGSNLTIINSNISDLLLQSNQTRSVMASVPQANLIGCRVKSLTAKSGTNLSIANFNVNIDKHDIVAAELTCPANVATEIGINNFTVLNDSDLYNYYDGNTPAGESVIYVTQNGWPQYAVDYVLSLYSEELDVSADVKDGEKINYYFESESSSRDIFTRSGFENIEKARICMVYVHENDKENYSDYKAYLEKIKLTPNADHDFYFFSTESDDCAVSFDSDEDGVYYEADSWQEAVTDYATAFECSEDEAKMQLFDSTDDAYLEEKFGDDDSLIGIYAVDWNETDEAEWIEHVVNVKCEQLDLTRDEVYRSDSLTLKNNNEILLIYIDESWYYENEKFEKNDVYYQIAFFSAVKK